MTQRLDLRMSNKHGKIQDNSAKNKKLKIIDPTWNDELDLPDGFYSVSDIQFYIENILKK